MLHNPIHCEHQSVVSMGASYVSSCNNFALTSPDQAQEWQKLRAEADYSIRRLVWTTWVDHSNATIMCSKSQSVSAWRESTTMHPARRVIQILAANSIERQSLSPDAAFWPLIDAFNEGRKDPRMGIGRPGGEEDRVWMPCDGRDGASYGFLQLF